VETLWPRTGVGSSDSRHPNSPADQSIFRVACAWSQRTSRLLGEGIGSAGIVQLWFLRIGVHDVVGLLQNGETVDSVTRQLPGLTRAQVFECLAYYEDHLAEVDYLVAHQMSEAGT